jgi:maleamate amidohydrolase
LQVDVEHLSSMVDWTQDCKLLDARIRVLYTIVGRLTGSTGERRVDATGVTDFSEVLDVYARQRVGGGRVGFGSRLGVLVIDLQHLYTRGRASTGLEAVERGADLLHAARAGGVPIAFARMGYDSDFDAGDDIWTLKCPGLVESRVGSEAAELDPLLERRPEEPLHTKRVPSALFDPFLRDHFRAHDIDTLLVIGTSTSGCVRATVVDGMSHGFRMVVVREGVADRSTPSEAAALFDIETKYGDVVPMEVALGEIARRTEGREVDR